MSRYIDADVFADRLLNAWSTADEQNRVDIVSFMATIVTPILIGTPTADVKEVVRGEWIKVSDTMPIYHCSNCNERNLFKDGKNVFSNFCPHCGADMRGDN